MNRPTIQMDRFDDCCTDISVIGDEMTTIAKNSDSGWGTIYGSKWIKLNETRQITKFEIKINKLRNGNEGLMYIGISSNDYHQNGRYSFYNDNRNYSFRSDGVIYHNSKYFTLIDQGYKTNDIITFIINPFNKKISILKNDKVINSQRYNTLSSNQYKLAISLFNKHDSVSIINQYNIRSHRDSSAEIISELVNKNDLLMTEIELLRNELASVKQLNRELQFENSSLKKQNKSMTKLIFDERDFMNWSVDEVISWIMDIDNGKYLKYFEMLNIRITDEQIDGIKLYELDYVDLKELGIIDIDDRKSLWRNIQLLIARNKHSKYQSEGDYHCSSLI